MPSNQNSGCLFNFRSILQQFLGEPAEETILYRPNPKFLSPAEVTFYRALSAAVSTKYIVFAKVRLLDIITPVSREKRQAHMNKVMSKHVDFALIDTQRHSVVAVVELDDSSHYGQKAIVRDEFVDGALKAAGIPTVRFRCRSSYDSNYIRESIEEELEKWRHDNSR